MISDISIGEDTSSNYFGRLRMYLPGPNGHLVVVGPHWYVHLMGLLVVTGGMLAFCLKVASRLESVWLVAVLCSFIAVFVLFLAIGFSNPGLETQQTETLPFISDRYCKVCRVVRRGGSIHCRDCDVCVLEYDHHCPWTGKCIGRDNLRLFYAFLSSISLAIILATLALLTGTKNA